ncbi:biopolymer transporter ExbD [Silvanigrella paludirubra]|uniref:Biopolymer transporter ExbD n=1 Tax=Silvanigrella paludirubra TaxID=2499159 RepID=A0A6N6VVV5_9BACT|nr:biopolymer transporter ExbD [Silvanigrella paludirubra]KAB8040603.1 biopolymer transporter ExbD [Silvanigrella paludirubra]
MAGKIGGGDDEPIVDINITPFVDVVLVLLVIFMVTAHFIVNKGMKLELPKAVTAEQLQNQKTFNISINKDGEFMLDGKMVTIDQLKSAARDATQSKVKVVAMISADKSALYNSVVVAMDALRSEGVSDFALQLDPATQKK